MAWERVLMPVVELVVPFLALCRRRSHRCRRLHLDMGRVEENLVDLDFGGNEESDGHLDGMIKKKKNKKKNKNYAFRA